MCKKDIDQFSINETLRFNSYEDFKRDGYLSLLIRDKDKYSYKRCMKRVDLINRFYRKPKIIKLTIGLLVVTYTSLANSITTRNDKNMEYFVMAYEFLYRNVKHTQYDPRNGGYGVITIVKRNT